MGKLLDIYQLFTKGQSVANPEAWKDGGNAVTLLVPLLMGLVKLAGDFGYGLTLSAADAGSIAAGIVAGVQFVVHNVSSPKAGILPTINRPDFEQTRQ